MLDDPYWDEQDRAWVREASARYRAAFAPPPRPHSVALKAELAKALIGADFSWMLPLPWPSKRKKFGHQTIIGTVALAPRQVEMLFEGLGSKPKKCTRAVVNTDTHGRLEVLTQTVAMSKVLFRCKRGEIVQIGGLFTRDNFDRETFIAIDVERGAT